MILFRFLSLSLSLSKGGKKKSVHVPCLSSQINLSALHVLVFFFFFLSKTKKKRLIIFFHILKGKKIQKDQNSLPSLELNVMRVIDTFKLIIEF